MKKFNKFISDISPTIAIMPLMHNCDVKAFIDSIDKSELPVTECDVFVKEKLLYCFYGKPAYRIKKDYSTGDIVNFPVCFIFDTKKLNNPYRIFPFDTGAFTQAPGMKEKYFHKDLDKLDYELPNVFDSARRVVEKFYGTNENYYLGKPILEVDKIPVKNIEARSYCTMIRDNTNTPYDDRLASVEIIFNRKIKLDKNSLLTIIIPSDLMDDNDISDLVLKKWKIKPIIYFKNKGNPIEYHGNLVTEAIKYMDEIKILNLK